MAERHDPPRHFHRDGGSLEISRRLLPIPMVKFPGEVRNFPSRDVGVDPHLKEVLEFSVPFADELALLLHCHLRLLDKYFTYVKGRAYPCQGERRRGAWKRTASTKASISPFNTASTFPVSTPVRWSLTSW